MNKQYIHDEGPMAKVYETAEEHLRGLVDEREEEISRLLDELAEASVTINWYKQRYGEVRK